MDRRAKPIGGGSASPFFVSPSTTQPPSQPSTQSSFSSTPQSSSYPLYQHSVSSSASDHQYNGLQSMRSAYPGGGSYNNQRGQDSEGSPYQSSTSSAYYPSQYQHNNFSQGEPLGGNGMDRGGPGRGVGVGAREVFPSTSEGVSLDMHGGILHDGFTAEDIDLDNLELPPTPPSPPTLTDEDFYTAMKELGLDGNIPSTMEEDYRYESIVPYITLDCSVSVRSTRFNKSYHRCSLCRLTILLFFSSSKYVFLFLLLRQCLLPFLYFSFILLR